MHNTTIVAICTPPGAGAIAIIRISGPEAITITDTLWRGKKLADAASHTAHLGTILTPDGREIDQSVATIFRGPNSFTGQDTVEISCHGSKYIQQTILRALLDAGARMAAPGEFSQRAFLNRRIDLAQAEGIADLIAAQSAAAHRLALSQTKGEYSSRLNERRAQLVRLAAMLELELDFSEEEVEFADRAELRTQAQDLHDHIQALADSYARGQAIRDGHPIAIVGAPNAGKSTLLNTILGDDLAIVSDIPGTTRDAIQATTTIGDHLVRFIDTAGLRTTDDTVEALGIERTHRHIADADTILWLIDPTADIATQTARMHAVRATLTTRQTLIPLLGKTDLLTAALHTESHDSYTHPPIPSHPTESSTVYKPSELSEYIRIDSRTSDGIRPLLNVLKDHLDTQTADNAQLIVTNLRHYESLRDAADALRRTIDAIDAGTTADLIALDLRDATHHLGTITGAITTDTLLTHIFSHFCIGK